MGSGAQQVIGRYTIFGKIASGGMASVHFGRVVGGAGFSRTVAIKRLHPHLAEEPEFLSTMIDEARLAARIHHPNVVPTLDVVSAEGELLLVMEYVRGESLARLAKADGPGARPSLSIASAIVVGALQGLHAAHEARDEAGAPLGIVHRDVSPQNILVGADGMARVIDFGVAKAARRLQTTQDGSIKGKIAYMAPEQVAAKPVTRTADVYAMGVILWELLTGIRIFTAENDAALVGQVLAGARVPPSRHAPGLSKKLDALVMRALAADPTARFATALEMAETLQRNLPPAFPSEVGQWCERVAREGLAKREALLADIERGVGPPRPSLPDASHIVVDDATPLGDNDILVTEADAPLIATQPSSLSIETPKPRPSVAPQVLARGRLIAGGLGAVGGLLIVALVVMWWEGKDRAAANASRLTDVPTMTSTPEATEARLTPSVAPQVTDRALGDSGAGKVTDPAPSESAAEPIVPRVANESAVSVPLLPKAVPTAVRTPAAAPAAPAPPASKPRSSCNPPYVLDSAGHHQYKPECL